MYHRAGFGEVGERSYPGRCNPHAWLKSGAIQPAKWYPFPRAEIFAPPAPGSHSPFRGLFMSMALPRRDLSFVIGGASGDAGGGWGCLQASYSDFDFHGLMACSFKSAAYGGSIAGVSSEGNSDMLFAAPTVIRWI
jgi:hypothetical protein